MSVLSLDWNIIKERQVFNGMTLGDSREAANKLLQDVSCHCQYSLSLKWTQSNWVKLMPHMHEVRRILADHDSERPSEQEPFETMLLLYEHIQGRMEAITLLVTWNWKNLPLSRHYYCHSCLTSKAEMERHWPIRSGPESWLSSVRTIPCVATCDDAGTRWLLN